MGCLIAVLIVAFLGAAVFGIWPVAGLLLIVFLILAIVALVSDL